MVLLDSGDFLVSKIKSINIKDGKLKCVVVGDSAENYKFTNDVKAITYNEMVVKQVSQEVRGQKLEVEGLVDKWVSEVVWMYN